MYARVSMAPAQDRLLSFLREKTLARVLAIGAFLGLLFLFRHLWATLLFFVAFERTIRFFELKIHAKTGWPKKRIVLGLVVLFVLALAGAVTVGVLSGFERWKSLKSTDFLEDLNHQPLWERYHHYLDDSEAILAHVKDYAGQALNVAQAVGRFFVQATIGFVMGVVYRLEAHELDLFEDQIDRRSLVGRLLRWTEHVADAVSVTMQLQLVVAAFNTVTTLPVLLLLGIPHVPSLMALIFVSALVPVIGNLVAGSVLCLMAYQAKGPLGLGVFLGVTFLLHKVESYYLSPRLTARHVRVPGFVLITSLIAFEHVFGFAGVFLSFPSLFVAARIRAEFLEEDGVLPPESVVLGKSLAPAPSLTTASARKAEASPSSPSAGISVSVAASEGESGPAEKAAEGPSSQMGTALEATGTEASPISLARVDAPEPRPGTEVEISTKDEPPVTKPSGAIEVSKIV